MSLVVLVSVVLRLCSALYQGNQLEPLPGVFDQISYHELSIRVLDGHGFTFSTGWWPATRANEPTAHWSFIYVLYLTGLYAISGANPIIPRLIQSVFAGIVQPWLTFRLGERFFGRKVGIAASMVSAVYAYFVFYAGALMTETFYFISILWVIDVATAVSARRDDRTRGWLLLGLALGVTVLLRQVFLLTVPFILLWVALRSSALSGVSIVPNRRIFRGVSLSLIVLVIMVVPWTVRNYKAFGTFVPLNTNSGFAFYWGNHPIHGTKFKPILDGGEGSYEELLPDEVLGLSEAEMDRALLKAGLGFVVQDPVRYVLLSLDRVKEYFKFWPSSGSSFASNLARVGSFGLFLPFFVGGILSALYRTPLRSVWKQDFALSLIIASLYTLIHVLTWTLVRYRLPVDAMLMPLVGYGILGAGEFFRSSAGKLRPLLRIDSFN